MSTFKHPNVVSENEVFWAEIAPTEHIVHLYGDETALMNLVENFAADGLKRGEGVIVIATDAHMFLLNERLEHRGFDLRALRAIDQYLDVNAEACLAAFMNEQGWPDEKRFEREIRSLLARAGKNGRRVRAFGEMVAILWEQKRSGATVRLEHLWNEFRKKLPFPLFCSYPKAGFTRDTADSAKEILEAHTKVIAGRA